MMNGKLRREIDSLNNDKLSVLIEYATGIYSARPEIKKEKAKQELIDDIEESLHYAKINLETIAEAKKNNRADLVPPMLENEQIAKQSECTNVLNMINNDYDALESNLESRLSELLNELRVPNTTIIEAQLAAKISIIKDLIERVKSDKEALSC